MDIVRRPRIGDGVKMTENEAMAGKTIQMLHASLVRDERWMEWALGLPSSYHWKGMLKKVESFQFLEILLNLSTVCVRRY